MNEPFDQNLQNWYIALDNQPKGPLSQESLLAYLSTGVLRPETLVWQDPMPDWLPAKDVPIFAHFWQPKPTVPSPPPLIDTSAHTTLARNPLVPLTQEASSALTRLEYSPLLSEQSTSIQEEAVRKTDESWQGRAFESTEIRKNPLRLSLSSENMKQPNVFHQHEAMLGPSIKTDKISDGTATSEENASDEDSNFRTYTSHFLWNPSHKKRVRFAFFAGLLLVVVVVGFSMQNQLAHPDLTAVLTKLGLNNFLQPPRKTQISKNSVTKNATTEDDDGEEEQDPPAAADKRKLNAPVNQDIYRDKKALMVWIKKHAPTTIPCLEMGRELGQIKTGQLYLHFRIQVQANDEGVDVKLLTPAPLVKTSFARCIQKAMAEWPFPETEKDFVWKNFVLGPIHIP